MRDPIFKLLILLGALILVGTFAVPAYLYAAGGASGELESLLREKTAFSGAEIIRLVSLMENAEKKGLPSGILLNKIREGVARRVPYAVLESALAGKIDNLLGSEEIIKQLDLERTLKKAKEYHLQKTSELLSSGMPAELPARLKRVSGGYLSGADILTLCDQVMGLVNLGVPYEYADSAVKLLAQHGLETGNIIKISGLLAEAGKLRLAYPEALDAIRYGAAMKKSAVWIKAYMRDMAVKAGRAENEGRKDPKDDIGADERRSRGQKRDSDSRGNRR